MPRYTVTNKHKVPDIKAKPNIIRIFKTLKVDFGSKEIFVKTFRPLAILAIRLYKDFMPMQAQDHVNLMDAIYTEVWRKRNQLIAQTNRRRFVASLMVTKIDAYCESKGWGDQLDKMGDGTISQQISSA